MDRRVLVAAVIVFTAGAVRAEPPQRVNFWDQKNVGTAVIVTGAILDVTALYFTSSAISERDKARDAGCRTDLTHCPVAALPTAESAYRNANRASVLFLVGTAAVGVGVYLVRTAPPRSVAISPAISPDAAGATLSGRF